MTAPLGLTSGVKLRLTSNDSRLVLVACCFLASCSTTTPTAPTQPSLTLTLLPVVSLAGTWSGAAQVTGCVDVTVPACGSNTFGRVGYSQHLQLQITGGAAQSAVAIQIDLAPAFRVTGESAATGSGHALVFRTDLYLPPSRFSASPQPRLAARIDGTGSIDKSGVMSVTAVITYVDSNGGEMSYSSISGALQQS